MEQPIPPSVPSEPETTEMPRSSLAGRLANVLASPGEVFSEIRSAPVSAANWLVPALLVVLIGWIGSTVVMSRPNIQQQIREMSSAAIEKQIKSQNMSPERAEQTREAAEKFGSIGMKIGTYFTPLLVGFAVPFVWGLVLWLGGRWILKSPLEYMKAVEVAGLANMVLVLDSVVRTLLILITGNIFASPSLALLVKEFDPQNFNHSLMALANVMVFWLLAVRAIGLARVAGGGFVKAAVWVFGIWAAYTGFFMAVGKAVQLIFAGKG